MAAVAEMVIAHPETEVGEVLSPSQVRTFMDCQARWMFQYLWRLPAPKNSNLALGIAVHDALGANFAQKVETRKDLPADTVAAEFGKSWDQVLKETEFRDDESPGDLKAKGEELVRLYMSEGAPKVQPVATEIACQDSARIGGVKVNLRLDVLEADGTLVEIKTAAKTPKAIEGPHAIQLAAQVLCTPGASGRVRVDTLVKNKTPLLVALPMDMTQQDLLAPERLYPLAQAGMRSGHYMPNRTSMLCSRRNCAYWRVCQDEFGGRVEES